MPENLVPYPIDATTRLPRLIYVTSDHYDRHGSLGENTHFHHLCFPKPRIELQDAAGKLLRYSYGERLPGWMHFNSYPDSLHHIFHGPIIPEDPADRARMALLAIAKVRPRSAIQLVEGTYEDQYLDDKQYEFVARYPITGIEDGHRDRRSTFMRQKMGRLLIEYAMSQDLNEIVSARVRQKFIEAYVKEKPEAIREMGNLIIFSAITEVISDAQPVYSRAEAEGMIPEGAPGLSRSVRRLIPAHQLGYFHNSARDLLEPELAQEHLLAA